MGIPNDFVVVSTAVAVVNAMCLRDSYTPTSMYEVESYIYNVRWERPTLEFRTSVVEVVLSFEMKGNTWRRIGIRGAIEADDSQLYFIRHGQ